jgi:hypothetical protein
MNARQLIASGAMALLLAPAAFANQNSGTVASMPAVSKPVATDTVAKNTAVGKTAARPSSCQSLEARFDRESPTSHAADIAKARKLRTEGAELCAKGKHIAGAQKLEEAVKMLGVSPASY